MRAMSDFCEGMWGVVAGGGLRARLRLRGLRRRAPRPRRRGARGPAATRAGSRTRVVDRELPSRARCVIVGGGVAGTSIAYHLAELGWSDVAAARPLASSRAARRSTPPGSSGQLRGSVSLTRMMMYSVELYRRLGGGEHDPGWIECGGIRLACTPERWEETRRQAGWAKTFGLPLELISAEEAQRAVPADGHRRRDRRLVAADRRLPRPEPAHLRARRRRAPRRLPDPHAHARDRDRRRATARCAACAPSAATSSARSSSTRAACTRPRSAGSPGVRVPVVPMAHEYLVTQPFRERDGAHAADHARPGPPRLLPRGGRRAGDGRLRAPQRAVGARGRRPRARRDPARLQRPPARGGLGPLRGDRRQRAAARAGDGGRARHAADQRARGVHARRRVLPRRDRGARAVRGRRLLRARARRRGRRRQGDGGVDRRRRAAAGPVADGHPALRRPLPLAPLHARARPRGLRDLLRHQVPQPRARRGPAAARVAGLRVASRARRRVRREVGLGARELVRRQRGRRATRRCARAAGPAGTGRRRSAPSTAPAARRRRCSTRRRSRRSRSAAPARPSCSSACATTASPARSGGSPTRRCSTAAAASSATSRSRGSPRTASRSSPARPSAATTWPGSPATPRPACASRTSRRAGRAPGCGDRGRATCSPPRAPTTCPSAT